MAGSLTRYGEQLVLNIALRSGLSVPGGTPNTAPTTLYLGLTKGAVSETSTLASIAAIEVSDSHYHRQPFTFKEPVTGGDGHAVVKNSADIQFGPWLAGEGADITYCFVTDAVSGTTGNIFVYMSLDAAKRPQAGDMLVFYTDGLAFSID